MNAKIDTRGLSIVKEIRQNSGAHSELKPSEIMTKFWGVYKENYPTDNKTVNGAVFEEIIGYILTIKGCTPFYMQARITYVPNVNYDFVLFDKELGPISISAKTTLRERWKQADLEAFVLKNVHRNALSYIVTLDHKAVATRTTKIKECLALNDFILADDEKFDQLIEDISNRQLVPAGTVEIVTSGIALDERMAVERYKTN